VTTSLTFVIPTRNRAQLAERAVRALLEERRDEVRVVVSDNSTEEAQATRLAAFCRGTQDPRLICMRAPRLTMPAHWDWALERVLERSDTSHISIHYDRKVLKPRQVGLLLDAIARHPAHVVTYSIDQVLPAPPGWALWQPPTTGRIYEIETARVLGMVSEGRIAEMGHAFPLLSNCAVPRAVLDRIRARFGDICNSTGPDAAFTFRHGALEASYLHLDRSLGVIDSLDRSNAAGYLGGTSTDFEDFKRAWGNQPWLDAVPIPGLNLGWNMLFHEYELVRRTVGRDRFPPISEAGYADGLAHGLKYIDDPDRRREYTALLKAHGWRPEARRVPSPPSADRQIDPPPASRARRLLRAAEARIVAEAGQGLRGRLLVAASGITPDRINGLTFRSERSALRFALRRIRRTSPLHPGLDWILEGDASRYDAGRPATPDHPWLSAI
jgi:glycosyltransferase involved in cell wall biosynthesis